MLFMSMSMSMSKKNCTSLIRELLLGLTQNNVFLSLRAKRKQSQKAYFRSSCVSPGHKELLYAKFLKMKSEIDIENVLKLEAQITEYNPLRW